MFEQPTHQAYHCPKDTPRSSSGLEKPFPPQERDANMSLTRFSRPFTISTYDPPSTPIALAAQDTGQIATVLAVNEQGYRLGGDTAAPRTRASIVGASEVWGRLRNTQATPPAKNKSGLLTCRGARTMADGSTAVGSGSGERCRRLDTARGDVRTISFPCVASCSTWAKLTARTSDHFSAERAAAAQQAPFRVRYPKDPAILCACERSQLRDSPGRRLGKGQEACQRYPQSRCGQGPWSRFDTGRD
jgi:hypothetical protein